MKSKTKTKSKPATSTPRKGREPKSKFTEKKKLPGYSAKKWGKYVSDPVRFVPSRSGGHKLTFAKPTKYDPSPCKPKARAVKPARGYTVKALATYGRIVAPSKRSAPVRTYKLDLKLGRVAPSKRSAVVK
jgi:hypothetical protein